MEAAWPQKRRFPNTKTHGATTQKTVTSRPATYFLNVLWQRGNVFRLITTSSYRKLVICNARWGSTSYVLYRDSNKNLFQYKTALHQNPLWSWIHVKIGNIYDILCTSLQHMYLHYINKLTILMMMEKGKLVADSTFLADFHLQLVWDFV
jgi:hypothetical protein